MRPGPQGDEREGAWPVDHTADLALRVKALSLEALFRHAALGLIALLADTERATPVERCSLELTGLDGEELLITWLGELLYRAEEGGYLWVDIQDLTITPGDDEWRLRAECLGERWDEERCPRRAVIKAATYHDLVIDPGAMDGFDLTIVFDT